MNQTLLQITVAFGLGTAAGLNASLPLLLVGALARVGLITLIAPFDALASDTALIGLLLLATLELLIDKIDGFDTIGHAILLPLSATAGAVLAASQTGAISGVDPGVTIVLGLLLGGTTAATLHTARAAVRWPIRLSLAAPAVVVSAFEDVAALTLIGTSLAAPVLVPIVLLVLLALGALLVLVLWWLNRLVQRGVRSAVRGIGRLWQMQRHADCPAGHAPPPGGAPCTGSVAAMIRPAARGDSDLLLSAQQEATGNDGRYNDAGQQEYRR
jgi:hypothetical protein